MRLALLVTLIGATAVACAPKMASVDPAPNLMGRLRQADELVEAGCLDCLLEARRQFEALRSVPELRVETTLAVARTSVLIATREDELGLMPGTSAASVTGMAADPGVSGSLAPYVDFLAAFIRGANAGLGGPAIGADPIAAIRITRERGDRALVALRAEAAADLPAAALWLWRACAAGSNVPEPGDRASVVARFADTPLLAFTRATRCPDETTPALADFLTRDPRFVEVQYLVGLQAQSGLQGDRRAGGRPDLDAADEHFRLAYAWRQDWPALTVAIANVAMTAEDFPRAFEFYDHTLALVPSHAGAQLGRVRALTYAGRYEEGIAAADAMQAAGNNSGDARYWRAFNEAQLERYDAAWDDVEQAAGLLINADVPKLAGIIAINRRDYVTARQRLELAIERRAGGCDALFYLQAVLAEQRDWDPAASRAVAAANCLDAEIADLTAEIAELRRTDPQTARLQRVAARRQAQRENDTSRRLTTWFNAAVANFNNRQYDEARRFALLVVDDERFADRAREILNRVAR